MQEVLPFSLLSCLHRFATFSLSSSTGLALPRSPWQLRCCTFRAGACYRGHADKCRSIPTPKLQHLSGSGVCAHAFCVYGDLLVHICWGISKMFGTQARRMPRLLSFNSSCPWGCQLSLLGHVRVFTCVYDGFCYQFMGDYTGSFHSYFSSMNILPSYKQKAISRLLFTQGQTGGGHREAVAHRQMRCHQQKLTVGIRAAGTDADSRRTFTS